MQRQLGWMLLSLCLLILSTGCSELLGNNPTATPIAVATLPPPTDIPTVAPTVTPTPIPPTATPEPTATPTLVPTPTETPLPTVTPDYLDADLFEWVSSAESSPNNEWVAEINVATAADKIYSEIVLSTKNGSVEYRPYSAWQPVALGNTTPVIGQWVTDGSGLFIAASGIADGCGILQWIERLQHVDLSTGVVTTMPLDGQPSTDGQQIAAFAAGKLILHEIATGQEREIAVDEQAEGGSVVWLPDSSQLAFTMVYDACGEAWRQDVVVLDVASGESEVVYSAESTPDKTKLMVTLQWPSAERMRLRDSLGQHYWLDLATRTLEFLPSTQVLSSEPLTEPIEGGAGCVTAKVPDDLDLPIFYKKYCLANGIAIVGSNEVPDEAFAAAWNIVVNMSGANPAMRDKMIEKNLHVAIVGRNESITDLPEFRDLPIYNPDVDWDNLCGIAGRYTAPVATVHENNVMCRRPDSCPSQQVLVHEFAHAAHWLGMVYIDNQFLTDLAAAFGNARRQGLWTGTYADTNSSEYWAEGVQAYFNTAGRAYDVNTRAELAEYDPMLTALIERVFPTFDWTPTCP